MRLTPLLLLGLLSACSPDKGDGGDPTDTSGHTGAADSADSAMRTERSSSTLTASDSSANHSSRPPRCWCWMLGKYLLGFAGPNVNRTTAYSRRMVAGVMLELRLGKCVCSTAIR